MLADKPVISNQHGALVMAFVPFIYAISLVGFEPIHLLLGFCWLCWYFFSYPFLNLFSKKATARNKKWAMIYALMALISGLPLLYYQLAILQFLVPIVPLVLIQIYFAKQKDERNMLNDIAGILTFGVVGMATAYLTAEVYDWKILLHPTLFFIATTFYIKSVVRERKNPRYHQYSLAIHAVLMVAYLYFSLPIAFAYAIALLRAWFVPKLKWNVKQVGISEFPIVLLFLLMIIWAG